MKKQRKWCLKKMLVSRGVMRTEDNRRRLEQEGEVRGRRKYKFYRERKEILLKKKLFILTTRKKLSYKIILAYDNI